MERDEVRRQYSELDDAANALHALLDSYTAAALEHADESVSKAIKKLHQLDVKGVPISDPDCDPESWAAHPLAQVRCEERQHVLASLELIAGVLGSASAGIWPRSRSIAAALTNGNLVQLAGQIAMKPRLTLEQQDDYCKDVAQLRWSIEGKRRLVTRSQIPYVRKQDLLVAHYGESTNVPAATASEILAVLLLDAPVTTSGSFAKRQGNLVSTDIAGLITTALPIFLRGIPNATVPFDLKLHVPVEYLSPVDLVALAPAFSLVCSKAASTASQPPKERHLPDQAIVPTLNPTARLESRVYVFGPIGNRNTTEVTACEGATCTASSDDKNVRTRVTIIPSQRGRFTLLAELALGLGVGTAGRVAPGSKTCGFAPQNTPTFQPVLGASGPDQVFELQQTVDPRNTFATSLLLGMHVTDRWFIGAGPSLLIGASGSGLTQWSLHAGVHPFRIPGVYFMFGPSFRFVPAPNFYSIGELVAVSPPTSGMAVAPSFSTHETLEFQLDVGLALDLGAAAAGAGSILSALGGK